MRVTALLFGLLLAASGAKAGEASVAVAANFTKPIRQLAGQFEEQTGHRLVIQIGSTGKIYTQIINGAPFDLFLAADSIRPQRLEREGWTVKGSRYTYAKGILVFWMPNVSKCPTARFCFESNSFASISIVNPKVGSYGYAAKELLEKLGGLNKYRSRIRQANTIAQAYQFVTGKGVEAGLVAMSLIPEKQRDESNVWVVPQEFYTPLDQQVVLLKRAADNQAAKAFLAYLKTPAVRKQILQFGYNE